MFDPDTGHTLSLQIKHCKECSWISDKACLKNPNQQRENILVSVVRNSNLKDKKKCISLSWKNVVPSSKYGKYEKVNDLAVNVV